MFYLLNQHSNMGLVALVIVVCSSLFHKYKLNKHKQLPPFPREKIYKSMKMSKLVRFSSPTYMCLCKSLYLYLLILVQENFLAGAHNISQGNNDHG